MKPSWPRFTIHSLPIGRRFLSSRAEALAAGGPNARYAQQARQPSAAAEPHGGLVRARVRVVACLCAKGAAAGARRTPRASGARGGWGDIDLVWIILPSGTRVEAGATSTWAEATSTWSGVRRVLAVILASLLDGAQPDLDQRRRSASTASWTATSSSTGSLAG